MQHPVTATQEHKVCSPCTHGSHLPLFPLKTNQTSIKQNSKKPQTLHLDFYHLPTEVPQSFCVVARGTRLGG